MTCYVVLLRAVNVGGTGKLSMPALAAMCREAGFARVETYIASGNAVFLSEARPGEVKAVLEAKLLSVPGRPVAVVVRTVREMQAVLEGNPYQKAAPNRVYAFFLDAPPPSDALDRVAGRSGEEIQLGSREIYVSYPKGMGQSKLKIPDAQKGTARNMNTVARLTEMALKKQAG